MIFLVVVTLIVLFSGSPARFPCGTGIASLAENKNLFFGRWVFWACQRFARSLRPHTVYNQLTSGTGQGCFFFSYWVWPLQLLIQISICDLHIDIDSDDGIIWQWCLSIDRITFKMIYVYWVYTYGTIFWISMNEWYCVFTIWYTCTCISWH